MNEKEKKAINNLKEFIKKQWIQLSNCCYGINKKTLGTMTDKEIYSIEIALNLIEKQQAEIEKLRKEKIEYQPSITITNSELLKGE